MADNYDISDDTQEYVNAIDQKIGDRYGVSLYNILNDSNALKGKDNAKQILIGMRADITEFFSSLTTKLKVEQEELENELKAADTLYNRINDLIKNKASFAGIPYVKPFGIERDTDNEENIVIDQFDNTVDTLITRLVGVVHYIADISAQYKEYNLGTWLFSGNKNYLLTINPPTSILFNIEVGKSEINYALDSIEAGL